MKNKNKLRICEKDKKKKDVMTAVRIFFRSERRSLKNVN